MQQVGGRAGPGHKVTMEGTRKGMKGKGEGSGVRGEIHEREESYEGQAGRD